MMRPSMRKWLFGLLALALMAAASWRVTSLNAQRKEQGLVLPPLPEGMMQPSMLLRPLLAVGRAPLVAVLWMRATKLKEQKRYFDAYQLSKMICELQPKFASVWAFQAWNMAYNISVTLKSPEERWRWVRNGYELLRDKAIPLNPNNGQLYKELAWILFHKVGDFMDEWHWYYKVQFALQMEDILGEPPADTVRPGRARGDFYRDYDFESLAKAPTTIRQLLEDRDVAEFVEKLETFGFDASEDGVFLGLLASLKEGIVKVADAEPGEEGTRLHELNVLMTDPGTQAARRATETFWRAHRLRNEVKLDPQRIVELQDGYGVTFDFRFPETQALYWANLGMEKGTSRQEAIDVHRLNTNRIEFYCLQKMFHRGRLAMSAAADLGEPPLLSPDIRVIPMLKEAFERDSKQYLELEFQKSPISTNFRTAYVGFMRTATIRYHELGRQKEAQALFDELKEIFPDPMYEKGLDGFLAEQFRFDRELNDYRVALARIKALITRGLIRYAYNEDEDALRYLGRAKQIYDHFRRTAVSESRRIQFKYSKIVEQVAHEAGGKMYRASYERICQKLGLEPIANHE
jgi:tetratricopeptide (TPR) repeat protein